MRLFFFLFLIGRETKQQREKLARNQVMNKIPVTFAAIREEILEGMSACFSKRDS